MAGFPYRAATGKNSGRSTKTSGVVAPLSANAAAAVAAAVGHASLSRRGAPATSSSTAARTALRGNDAASSPASAAEASDPGEAGVREGSKPGTRGLDGRTVLSMSSVSTSASKPRSPKASSASISKAATDTAETPTVPASRYITTAAAPAANASSAAGKSGSSSLNGGAIGPVTTVDLFGRRVWDKSYYKARAQSKEEDEDYLDFLPAPRQKKVAPPVEHRRPLQQRDFSIDLSKELGRTKIVTLQTPRMQQGGFWCDVCECLIKDSAAYLDHVNGRNHNRMLGMTMRVERAPPERVIGKLRELERQAQLELEGEDCLDNTAGGGFSAVGGASAEGAAAAASSHIKTETASAPGGAGAPAATGKVKRPLLEENYDDIDRIKRRLEELQKQEEERKLRRKQKKKRKRAESATAEGEDKMQHVKLEEQQAVIKQQEQDETEEQKMLKAMGLPSGFGGS